MGLFGDMHWCRLLKNWSLRCRKKEKAKITVEVESKCSVNPLLLVAAGCFASPSRTVLRWPCMVDRTLKSKYWLTIEMELLQQFWLCQRNVSLFSAWFLWSGPYLETKIPQKELLFSCMFGAWNCRLWCPVFWGTCSTGGKAFFVVAMLPSTLGTRAE